MRLSTFTDKKLFVVMPGEQEIQLQMPYCCLKPSSYIMKLSLGQGPLYLLDAIESFEFRVNESGNMSQCLFYQPRDWKIISKNNYCQTGN